MSADKTMSGMCPMKHGRTNQMSGICPLKHKRTRQMSTLYVRSSKKDKKSLKNVRRQNYVRYMSDETRTDKPNVHHICPLTHKRTRQMSTLYVRSSKNDKKSLKNVHGQNYVFQYIRIMVQWSMVQ